MDQLNKLVEYINTRNQDIICITINNSGYVAGSIITGGKAYTEFKSKLDTCYDDFLEFLNQKLNTKWEKTNYGSKLCLNK